MLGNGNGTFQSPNFFTCPQTFQRSIFIIDVNNDNKNDVITTSFSASNVLLGNGNGTFQSPQSFSSPNPADLFVIDVNNDNKADIITANPADSDRVQILLGNGDGTFD